MANNVYSHTGFQKPPHGGSGEPPDMNERLRNLEKSVAVMESNYATKTDISDFRAEMHSLLRQQIMWSVGSVIATGGLVFAILRFAGS